MRLLRRYFQGDAVIWALIVSLLVISLLAVYSSTGTLAYKYRGGNTIYYLIRHALFMGIGLSITYLVHRIHYKYYTYLANALLYLAGILLLFTLMLGVTRNEATRWLTLPVVGIKFQTSDFAKFALIMYVAKMLAFSQKEKALRDASFQPIMIATAAICGLILPENFSTAALLFITVWVMLYIGRMDTRKLGLALGALAVAVMLFISVAWMSGSTGRIGTWKNRIEAFVSQGDPDANYQSNQAKIAIVSGGLFGKGPGNSTQRNFLPHPYSDFIYAIIIEEYGLAGGVSIMFLYLVLLYRAGRIVSKCNRTFPAFLVIGLIVSISFQAFINMAVAVNLFPVTGQPLPLVSMGGTSILFTSIALGIILSISRTAQNNTQTATA